MTDQTIAAAAREIRAKAIIAFDDMVIESILQRHFGAQDDPLPIALGCVSCGSTDPTESSWRIMGNVWQHLCPNSAPNCGHFDMDFPNPTPRLPCSNPYCHAGKVLFGHKGKGTEPCGTCGGTGKVWRGHVDAVTEAPCPECRREERPDYPQPDAEPPELQREVDKWMKRTKQAEREREQWKSRARDLEEGMKLNCADHDKWKTRAEQAERERDAAVEALEEYFEHNVRGIPYQEWRWRAKRVLAKIKEEDNGGA